MGPPKVVLAPDAFKGGPDAFGVVEAMARGAALSGPVSICRVPMADGGEGTAEVVARKSGIRHEVPIVDVYGRPATGYWIESNGRALVESAVGSGFMAQDERRGNPMETTSYGTGCLIRDALACPSVHTVYLCLGGTGSTDGGIGLLGALGGNIFDRDGRALPACARSLGCAVRLSLPHLSKPLIGWYDVDVPLLGPLGCTFGFGSQKGLKAEQLPIMEAAMADWADQLANMSCDCRNERGVGAAGGMGLMVRALGGSLLPGAPAVAESVGLDHHLAGASLCLTGEGRADRQSLRGKVIETVARYAARAGVPCLALVGSVVDERQWFAQSQLTGIIPILSRPLVLAEAMRETEGLVAEATWRTLQLWFRLHPVLQGMSRPKGGEV